MEEDESRLMFKILATAKQTGARVGCLHLREAIQTPNCIGLTSRGAIPHIAQDVLSGTRSTDSLYFALEDFIERAPQRTPPILDYKPTDGASPLRRFTCQDDQTTLILGARRVPAVQCPNHNSSSSISIFTNLGFTQLSLEYYTEAVRKLQPDIAVALADIPHGATSISRRRTETMTDRTSRWMQRQTDIFDKATAPRPVLFAPLLPLPSETQQWYLNELADKLHKHVAGLAIYDTVCLPGLPDELASLPRLAFTEPPTPQRILFEIAQGIDLFTVTFIGAATDAGIALSFSFPATTAADEQSILPLGIDMWSEQHEADLSPLVGGCDCEACSNHHRAYVRHLLTAKEMLGWTLLQVHNHAILGRFFADIRSSISNGTYDDDRRAFEARYEPTLPAKTGQGPRVRGYQYKSDGPGETKRNPRQYVTLDDAAEKLAESKESSV